MLAKTTLTLLSLLIITACVGTKATFDARKNIKKTHQEIEERANTKQNAAVFISAPPVNLNPLQDSFGPSWLNAELNDSFSVDEMPLHVATEWLLREANIYHINVKHARGVDVSLDTSVRLNKEGATIRDGIEQIATATGLHYEAADMYLKWSIYDSETFSIPAINGSYLYEIGDKPETGGISETTGSTVGGGGEQFSRFELGKTNALDDIKKAIDGIIGSVGNTSVSKFAGTVTVRTTPALMDDVREFMDDFSDAITAQALVEIRVIQAVNRNKGEGGVSWKMIKEQTGKVVNFVGESPSLFTNIAPVKFSSVRTGNHTTIDTVISAMETQANIVNVFSKRVLATNNAVSKISIQKLVGYVQTTTTTSNGSSDLAQTDRTPGTIADGESLYIIPKIIDEHVMLYMSSNSTRLIDLTKAGKNENFIQLPSVSNADLNAVQFLKSGTTAVAMSLSKVESKASSASPLSADYIPTYSAGETETVEIYVFITTQIIPSS